MALRFDDANRILELSVHDLVDGGAPRGDLVLQTVQSSRARLEAGRVAHLDYQAGRGAVDDTFRAEVRLRRQLTVGEWTVVLHGRADGLAEDGGALVVEEVKSTLLDASRLLATELSDWPAYAAQLEVYLWMVADERRVVPAGRLVLVSLLDGARHVLGMEPGPEVGSWIRGRLDEIVSARDERLSWLASRRRVAVPVPFEDWRPGQATIAADVERSLDRGEPVLVEAPTGLGKTAAILYGVLRHAMAHDKQVFWATARTTQQRVVQQTLDRFRQAGLPLRAVTIAAKAKVCLNDVVACRPDRCRFAAGYYDKVREQAVVGRVLELDDPEALSAVAQVCEVCPYELALDASERVDVVVGDYNYVFDPWVTLNRHFADNAGDWVVVVDEAHHLVERARGFASPRVTAAAAIEAQAWLGERGWRVGWEPDDSPFAPFAELAAEVADAISASLELATGPRRDGVSVADLSSTPWRWLSDRIDEAALDYARLQAEHPSLAAEDPWVDCARAVQRFTRALERAGGESVHLVGLRHPFVGLLCLDPSGWVGPRIASLGGFVGCSATLTPTVFYRDLLGLDPDRLRSVDVPPVFPPEHRRVLVAPRVSTAYRDRPAHAQRTARLIEDCIRAVPGNVAVYFPSFAMLQDIVGRWGLDDHEVLVQTPNMPEQRRRRWLDRLDAGGAPVVLAAVLGGIFAEGIDLPPGALAAVLVAGPALPPVGLERDLLRDYYEQRYGEGFRYASLVPGMTRVVQAAGRLIRRPEDRGVIVLVGRRFRWRDIADLLPGDWEIEVADDPAAAVASFWTAA